MYANSDASMHAQRCQLQQSKFTSLPSDSSEDLSDDCTAALDLQPKSGHETGSRASAFCASEFFRCNRKMDCCPLHVWPPGCAGFLQRSGYQRQFCRCRMALIPPWRIGLACAGIIVTTGCQITDTIESLISLPGRSYKRGRLG